MGADPSNIRGRGASANPSNRFELLHYERDPEAGPDDSAPTTQFFRDSSRSIIARNDSPDVGFEASINPYRGCEHGCAYCYSRPTHEYLGFNAGIDFESKILVKERAPELFREFLARDRWQSELIAMSGVTDCYQPAERRFRLTRACLEVLAEARRPIGIITKNGLLLRHLALPRGTARRKLGQANLS